MTMVPPSDGSDPDGAPADSASGTDADVTTTAPSPASPRPASPRPTSPRPTSPRPTSPRPTKPVNRRALWHLRANAGVILWLLALLVVTVAHRFLPASTWLLIHLLLLGAITNAIVVWSRHFTDAVTRARPGGQAAETVRLLLLNAGIATVVGGMMAPSWPAVLIGGCVVGTIVIWHGAVLWVQLRRALPARFAATVHYYVAAAALLPFGIAAGIILADSTDADRLTIAHLAVNLLGWVGLTVLGTLITLWATMLRTKIVDGAERAAAAALWILTIAVVATAAAALLSTPPVAAFGVAAYLVGIAVAARPLVAEARVKPPHTYATYSVTASLAWLVIGLVWLIVLLLTAADWTQVVDRLGLLLGPLVAGFAAQVLLGALSYLVPVVTGGGPVATRAATAALDRGAAWRIGLINFALAIWLLPVPSIVAVATSIAALVGYAAFLPLLWVALRASRRATRDTSPAPSLAERRAAAAAAKEEASRPGRFVGPAGAAVAAVALVVAVAVALDPSSVGAGEVASAADGAVATGEVTTVRVEAHDMRFHPDVIEVPVGNRLVIDVVNTDTVQVHDLVLATGQSSGRLAPGEAATVDVGVVGRSIDGWCSVFGHRQMGMVMSIIAVDGSGRAVAGTDVIGNDDGPDATGTGTVDANPHGAGGGPGAAADLDFQASPPEGFTAWDATVPPVPPGRVHHVTFTVRNTDTEVAPGVFQTLWTYDADEGPGSMPGPTLHGRVGDTFVVHLINDGDIGHSIDFHAGALAPDLPMRTIDAGESLDYTFTATKAGIWLYHCSTAPMSGHIANGMFGAVIIDPPGLEPVDREYVLIGSELYLGPQHGQADVDKITARSPDAYVFNGYVNQYRADPLVATVGDRVRIWVLAAGPNEALPFHIVGGQFDTVFFEGSYLLRPGNAESGGSQTLGLAVSQGGFVEMVMPEAGHYSLVSHIMSNAEEGQQGTLLVTED